jgi:hypothetical protein
VVRANPANFTPRVVPDSVVGHPHVDAFSRSGGVVYAGGTFRTVRNAAGTRTYRRQHVMAFDASTGAVHSFAPRVDGPVWSVQAVGKAVYLGGSFRNVNGVRRPGLVKVDARTGKVRRRFNAGFDGGRVNEIHRVGRRLVVGGSIPGALVALKPRTGRNTGYLRLRVRGEIAGSWGRTAVYHFAVSPDGKRLVAVGNFTMVAGKSRKRAFMVRLGNRPRLARLVLQGLPQAVLLNRCAPGGLPARRRLLPARRLLRGGVHRADLPQGRAWRDGVRRRGTLRDRRTTPSPAYVDQLHRR